MCLSTVYVSAKNNGRVSKKMGKLYGYKSIDVYGKSLSGTDYLRDIKLNKWMTANDLLIKYEYDKYYTSGFHIFLDKFDAKDYCGNSVFLVEFSDIVSIGKNTENNKAPTVIAKRMKVIRKLKPSELDSTVTYTGGL
jgi:hypothetical protein